MSPLWNLGAVMSEATSLVGNRADMAASRVSLYANQAMIDVQFAVEPQDLEAIAVSSTTSGENKITLPTDFYNVVDLSNLSVSPPATLTKWNVMDIDSQNTGLGAPTNYVMYSTWLELWPSPDSAYSIQMRYQARASVLTTTTAVPSFDTRFCLAWLYRTTALCADALKDWETAGLYQQKYLSEIASKPNDLALRQRDRDGANVRLALTSRQRVVDFDNSIGPGMSIYGP